MKKYIILARGQKTIVDPEDYDYLNGFKWHLSSRGYAVRSVNGGNKKIFMHQMISEAPSGFETDHINRNKLDNRRSNLRVCTRSDNNFNRVMPKKYKPRMVLVGA